MKLFPNSWAVLQDKNLPACIYIFACWSDGENRQLWRKSTCVKKVLLIEDSFAVYTDSGTIYNLLSSNYGSDSILAFGASALQDVILIPDFLHALEKIERFLIE